MARAMLPFWGVNVAGASDELVKKGRRRVVALLSFTTFCLLVAACADNDWVVGGLEYNFSATEPLTVDQVSAACNGCLAGLDRSMLGDTVTLQFHLGLSSLSQATSYAMPYTGEQVERDCQLPVQPFIRYVNAAATANDTNPRNIWRGLAPIPDKFSATLGLLGFAAFLQIAAWLAVVAVQYEAPRISGSKVTLWAVRVLVSFTLFFTFVAVLLFGTAPIKSEFCKAFDPDADYIGLPCGFGKAFNVSVAALIFAVIECVAAWWWMGLDLPASYEFSGASAKTGATAGFSSPGATAYEPVGDSRAGDALTSSAYQS